VLGICKEAGHARRDIVEQEMMEEGREWKEERGRLEVGRREGLFKRERQRKGAD
jgi:hypothetical protein